MKLWLRDDVYYAVTDEGACFLTSRGEVRFEGAAVGRWIERLVPRLDGRSTLTDLTATLDPDRTSYVERLVGALRQSGIVTEPPDDPAPTALSREYAREIGFLAAHGVHDRRAFLGYRATATLVTGAGRLLEELAAAALASGLESVTVAEEPPGEGEAPRRDIAVRDAGQSVRCWTGDPLAELPPETGLVLQVTSDAARAARLSEACREARVPLAQLVLSRRDEAWLVPPDADWAGAWPRLRAVGGERPDSRAEPPAHAGRLLTLRLVQAAFRTMTGAVPPASRGLLTRVATDSMESTEHRCAPHPLARPATAPDAARRTPAPPSGERLSRARVLEAGAEAGDRLLGCFTPVETDWAQLPLRVRRALVPDPAGSAGPLVVDGSGFHDDHARARMTLRALAAYGSLVCDPRRLTADGLIHGYEPDEPERVRPVPAGQVFPGHPLAKAGGFPDVPDVTGGWPRPGVAAGQDWAEAVGAALAAQAARLTLAALPHTAARHPRVDLDGAALDAEGERARAFLRVLGEDVEVYDVTGPLGVPVYVLRRAGTALAAAALDPAAALGDGLRKVLQAIQSEADGRPAYAPPGVPDLPASRRASPGDPASPVRPALGPAQAAARLRAAGRVPVAVPLDHDRKVAELMPYLVHVVLCDA
ncbi:hypothetical protein [Nonomuraea sp. KM88]|uniref:hypothetical protein n=1 Tax=Nonomuraea sp. KM88 TaxID=3457427 RepID=UPI003FCDD866